MSFIPVEKTFPRGGLKEFSAHSRPSFQPTSLFRVKKPRHIPRNNYNDDSLNNSNDYNSTQQKGDNVFRIKKFTGQLTYKTVSEGMLSIGAIFAITELELKISLPGNIVATAPITNISETYTTALRNAIVSNSNERIASLREMFKIGQHVVVRVVGKELQDNRHKITLSLDPQVIYSNINPEDVCKGSIVIASVKSIEDKGYVMALGDSSIRAFLNHEQATDYELAWNDCKGLGLGQIVRCYVEKTTTLDSTTTLVLSAKPTKVAKANYDKTGSTLESLMPGMKFTASVSHLFPNGIQVQLSDNFVGYVYRDHFEAPFKRPENYEIGMTVKAHVLYILPNGVIYFTLKTGILEATPPTDPYAIIKCGEIITNAKVFGATDMGLVVKVGNHENIALKGFVPLNQTSYRSRHDHDEFGMPISQQLQMEFPFQSDVTCRVMDFNYMENYYVCTMDKELMNEKIINPVLLEVGMVVPCTIKSIQLKGIVLSIGKGCHATGFVPLTYMSDVLLSNPEKKFHVGQACTARVLSLKDGKIMLTMKRLQVQSNDPILTSFEDATVGDVYSGTVQQINEHGLLIQFYNFVSGWLPTTYLGSDTSRTNITSKYDLGQVVPCKIVSKDETQNKLVLALWDFEIPSTNGVKKEEKSKKRKEITEDDDTDRHLAEWKIPQGKAKPVQPGVLSKRAAKRLKAEAKKEGREREKLSSDGKLESSENSAQKRKSLDSKGETENEFEPPKKKADSQTNNVSNKEKKELEDFTSEFEVGMIVPCTVKSIQEDGIVLSAGKDCHATGFVPRTYVSDFILSNFEKKFHVGQTCTARVLALKDGKITFTMKPLQVESKDPILTSLEDAKEGDVYNGTVQQIDKHGLRIQFYNFVNGWLPIRYLGSRTNVTSKYDLGQVVPCKILSKDETKNKLVLALRDWIIPRKSKVMKEENKKVLKEKKGDDDTDQHLALQPVVLSKSAAKRLKAEAKKEQQVREKTASSEGTLDLSESSAQKQKTSESKGGTDSELKPPTKKEDSQTNNGGENEAATNGTPGLSKRAAKRLMKTEAKLKVLFEQLEKEKKELEEWTTEFAKIEKKEKADSKESKQQEDKEPRENDPIISDKATKKRKNDESEAEPEETKLKTTIEQVELKLPALAVANGFVWDATPNLLPIVAGAQDEPESSDEEEEQTTTQVKKTRQAILNEKRIQAQQEEARLRKIEQRLMDEDTPPQSADEFDRLVLSSPDSSIVWLQYMTFHLQATEIEKAKNIGLRALNTISFREEQERLNVWGALLNLENLYGTKESLETTLEEAIKNNDAFQVHNRMLAIFGDSGKLEEGDKLITTMTKKFRENKDVWYNAAVFYMKSAQMEKARALLPRALSVLLTKDHVGTITRFAQLENRLGSKERAQTLMEQILTCYPKRIDVWGQYVDMLVKSGLIPMARQVLERAVCQSLPAHKMKTMFKKFLAFEEAHGTEDDAQKVRLLALKYVESSTGNEG